MPSLADLWGPGAMPPRCLDPWLLLCVSRFSMPSVSRPNWPLQIYSLDLPVHAIVRNVTRNTQASAMVGTHFVSNNHISPCARLIWQPGRNVISLTRVQI